MNWNIFDCALIKQSSISLTALQRINCAEWYYYRIECRDILNQNFFEIMLWYLTLNKYNIKSSKSHNHIYYFTRYDLYISLPLLNFRQILKIVLVSKKLDEVTPCKPHCQELGINEESIMLSTTGRKIS